MNTSQLGNIGEAKILGEFTKRQIPIFLPYGDGNIVDLIADFNGKLNKIQVKTTEKLHDNSYMSGKITRQEGYHGNRVKYSQEDLDYFCLYCLETDIVCLVPFSEIQNQNTIKIRLDSYDGTRLKTMRFVSDYNIDKIITAA